jgi:hypothetical protein
MVEGLISAYLGRLEAAAWPLPPSRRSELTAEVREHIETALAEAGSRDEVSVRNVLDRLGRPEDIVAAEVEAGGGRTTPGAFHAAGQTTSGWMAQAAARGWGALEIVAVLLLTLGSLLLWFVGPIAGVIVAWFSERWTARQKRVATTVVFGSVAVEIVLMAVFMSRAFGGWMGFGGMEFGFGQWPVAADFGFMGLIALASALLPLVAGLGTGIYLALALRDGR